MQNGTEHSPGFLKSHKIFLIFKILNYMTVAQGQPFVISPKQTASKRESKLHGICGAKKIAIIIFPLFITIRTGSILQNNINTLEITFKCLPKMNLVQL